ncbi:fimbria/pilus periplasmic chaperone [Enterovibrio coralii]|uniref:Pili assembly chaperone N-terminal domain-containing protein n=1 Tax=Enterovibrio coralii TaxID=294935 RepID=A0A135I6P4_9GAMM|nr:fimbria/pilus periplasmic chaperone [Enterovibrio coralii]KXF81113.1 hypothetical protein ATN88_19345 [Enterovibrio coralii]
MHRLLFCIAVAFSSFQLGALTISPTVLELSTDLKSSAQIRLENTSLSPTPIEVAVRKLVFDENGNFNVENADDSDLMVFPPAAVLAPGGVQIFRLQWVGQPQLPQSESVFIRFTQPAIEELDESAGSALAVEIHYNALVHLSSSNQQPLVTLDVDESGAAAISNRGNRYTFLSKIRFYSEALPSIESPETVFGERFLPPFSTIAVDVLPSVKSGRYVGEKR